LEISSQAPVIVRTGNKRIPTIDLLRVNGTLLLLGLPLFFPGSPVQSDGSEKRCLVVVEDVGLGSTDVWGNPW
jgi:hypothetical protein